MVAHSKVTDQDEDVSGESGCFEISKVTKGPNLGWEMNVLTHMVAFVTVCS